MKQVYITDRALQENSVYWLTCNLDLPDEFIVVKCDDFAFLIVAFKCGKHSGINTANDLWKKWQLSDCIFNYSRSTLGSFLAEQNKESIVDIVKEKYPDDLAFFLFHPEILSANYFPDGTEKQIITRGTNV